jgi:cell division septation protein DedD
MGMDVEGQDQTLYAAGAGIDEGSDINLNAGPEAPLPRPGSAPMGDPEALLPPDMGNDAMVPAAAAPVAPAPATQRPAPPVAKPAPLVVPKPAPAPAAKLALPKPVPTPVAKPAPVAKPVPAPVAKPVPAPVAKPAAASGSVQLGAFGTAARAETVWSELRARHGMAGFSRQVSPIERDGKTLYRLRASGGDARATCARLTAAGDACTVVE